MREEETGRCSLCGDAAHEAVVLELPRDGEGARARMLASGSTERVALELVPGVRPGDRVLVHMGFAIARLPDVPVTGRRP